MFARAFIKLIRPAGKVPIVAVPPEQRQAIEDAIMEAFLAGTDDNFDKLLEVSGQIPPWHSWPAMNALSFPQALHV